MDPVGSFTIIIAFLLPASEVVAENWLMRLLTALETREREKASDTIEILMFHRVFYSEVQL